MADKQTPDEELPPRRPFERLVEGPEGEDLHSATPPSPAEQEGAAPQHNELDEARPEPADENDDSVLDRFDALKQLFEETTSGPPEEPSLSELDAQIRAARRSERDVTLGQDDSSLLPEPSQEHPTYDDLEKIKIAEAQARRRETRKAKRKSKRRNRSFWKELPALIVVSVVVAIVIKTFFFQAFYIPSASMVPKLEINDRVLVNKLSYRFGAIERGDILVFDSPEAVDAERSLVQRVVRRVGEATGLVSPDTVLIKRVIALPGQTIEIRDNQIYINDSPIAEPYIPEGVTTRDMDPLTVPADFVFMMGDNRNQSRDSRVFGPIHKDDVVGRAFVRVWPPSRWDGL